MKMDIPAMSAKVKRWGPFILIDNEMMSGVILSLPWPFSGVQIQIVKVQGDDL